MKLFRDCINWFKTLNQAIQFYHRNNERLDMAYLTSLQHTVRLKSVDSRMNSLEKVLRDRTTLSLDASGLEKSPNIIIVSGRYNGMDYVETFRIDGNHFDQLIQTLKNMERYAYVARADVPYHVRGVFKKEFDL